MTCGHCAYKHNCVRRPDQSTDTGDDDNPCGLFKPEGCLPVCGKEPMNQPVNQRASVSEPTAKPSTKPPKAHGNGRTRIGKCNENEKVLKTSLNERLETFAKNRRTRAWTGTGTASLRSVQGTERGGGGQQNVRGKIFFSSGKFRDGGRIERRETGRDKGKPSARFRSMAGDRQGTGGLSGRRSGYDRRSGQDATGTGRGRETTGEAEGKGSGGSRRESLRRKGHGKAQDGLGKGGCPEAVEGRGSAGRAGYGKGSATEGAGGKRSGAAEGRRTGPE